MPTRRACLASLTSLAALLPMARAAAQSPGDGAFVFRFDWLDAGGSGAGFPGRANLDLGSLRASAAGRGARRIALQRRLLVRVDGPARTVRVSAALAQDAPGTVLRIDGQPLSTFPRLLDSAHRTGIAVPHLLELEVAPNVPPGPLLGQVLWTAETA